jgi:ankyrin repeat protein
LRCEKVAKGDVEVTSIVTSLLERGADIDAKDTQYKETPLHIAARNGSRGAVETLLGFNNPVAVTGSVPGHLESHRRTVNVNLENKNKYTPLSIAIRHGRTEIIRLMLERATPSADLSRKGPIEKTSRTVTTFENALRRGNNEIVKLFLEPARSTFKEIDTPWDSDLQCTPLS